MHPTSTAAMRSRIRGLYAITPGWDDTTRLLTAIDAALGAGVRLIQYRAKDLPAELRRTQFDALKTRCEAADALLVLNDDWRLAPQWGARAVHIGSDDGAADAGQLQQVRNTLGPDVLIGVSCYGDLERARQLAPCADYLAFGAVFTSGTKPQARPASLELFAQARPLGLPLVAIGGIDASNATRVMQVGADAVAVIGGMFGHSDKVEGSVCESAQTVSLACHRLQAALRPTAGR